MIQHKSSVFLLIALFKSISRLLRLYGDEWQSVWNGVLTKVNICLSYSEDEARRSLQNTLFFTLEEVNILMIELQCLIKYFF